MNQFEDEQLVCADCGVSFVFSGGEAAFYAQRNLAYPPKRCKECRAARKDRAPRPNGDGAPRAGGAPRDGGYRPSGDRPRFDRPRPSGGRYTGATDEYRSPMQDNVYFAQPAWGRSNGQGQAAPPRRNGGFHNGDGEYRAPSFRDDAPHGYGASREGPRGMARGGDFGGARPRAHGTLFDITCKTCGTQAQVPFRPIEGRDVFCQACYRARKPIRHEVE